jgi:predicted nuclease with TOPRIM domain
MIKKFFNWLTGRTDLFSQIDRLQTKFSESQERVKHLESDRSYLFREVARLQKFEKDHFHDVEDLKNRLKTYARAERFLRKQIRPPDITGEQMGLINS